MNNDVLEVEVGEVETENYVTVQEDWEVLKEEIGERLFGELEYD